MYSRAGHIWQYGASVLHAGYLGYKYTLRICTITAFPLQQWLYERALVLSYTSLPLLLDMWSNQYNAPTFSSHKNWGCWNRWLVGQEVRVIGTTGYGPVDLRPVEKKILYEELRLRGRKHLTGSRDEL